jgi:pimeloyl-ACP methyl ester carboxylesterase
LTPSRLWKGQIPYLARRFRVVTFDPRGGGRSDRPEGVEPYFLHEHVADALAVMDATGTERAVLITVSFGARVALVLAADHPERVAGAAIIGAFLPVSAWPPERARRRTFVDPSPVRRAVRTVAMSLWYSPKLLTSRSYRRFVRQVKPLEAFRIFHREGMLRDRDAVVHWLVSTVVVPDPHSTRQIEDTLAWVADVDARTLTDSFVALDTDPRSALTNRDEIHETCRRVSCPVLVIHGTEDIGSPPEWGTALAAATRGRIAWIDGGHAVQARYPVKVNLLLREFAESCRAAEPVLVEQGRQS